MTRLIAVLLAVTGLVGTTQAYAQEVTPGPGRVEVSIIPAGGVFFIIRGLLFLGGTRFSSKWIEARF